MDGLWTVSWEKMGFCGIAWKGGNPSKVLKMLINEKSGEGHERPVTPEVASSSLVGPTQKIKRLR